MKEFIIFLIIFLIVFGISVFIFNGRYIYEQTKYSFIGAPSTSKLPDSLNREEKELALPDKLIIPSLNIEAPVVISQSTTEVGFQKDLEKGIIYLPGSSALNEKGTMVIMGHSSAYPWYKGQYGSIFALLNKLNINDEILVFSQNKTYAYRVLQKEIKAPKDLVFQTQKEESVLYLVSCWPVNTSWKRIVIKTTQVLDKN
jgi:sortase (surface protein transpeptidase)